MESEIDEITDLAGQQLRITLLVGVYLAQGHLERRRQLTAQQTSEARARLQRLDRERTTRIAALERVHSESFWAYATPDEIRRAFQTALSYRDSDPAAQHAYRQITGQLQQRYGVDVTALQHDQPDTGLTGALARQDAVLAEIQDHYDQLADQSDDPRLRDRAAEIEQTRRAIATEFDAEVDAELEQPGGRGRHDRREAARELLIADTATTAPFDSSERREQWGRQLRAAGVSETAAQAAVLADVCFAQPPEEATRHSAARHAAAAEVRGAATVKEAGPELER